LQSLAVPAKGCSFSHAFHALASYSVFQYGIATDMRAQYRADCHHTHRKNWTVIVVTLYAATLF
jgi:hypothetical protein